MRGSPHYSHEVTAIDHIEAMRADLIFFICMDRSIGMGIEAQVAANVLIPWTDAKPTDKFGLLAPLLAGLPNPCAGSRIKYEANNLADFERRLRQQLQSGEWCAEAWRVHEERELDRTIIRGINLGPKLRRQRFLLNLSSRQFAELVDLEPWFIEAIEKDNTLTDCLSILQFMRIINEARRHYKLCPGCCLQFLAGPVDSTNPNVTCY